MKTANASGSGGQSHAPFCRILNCPSRTLMPGMKPTRRCSPSCHWRLTIWKTSYQEGMTEEMICRNGYKTMPVAGFSAIAKQLHEEGHYLAGVPGFYHDMAGNWTISKERRGILVPARTPEGKIQGLQIRLDSIKKGKFRWITSIGKQDGCKAECWTHIAGEPTPTVLLTEGPMKADVIHHITGLTVLRYSREQPLLSLSHCSLRQQFISVCASRPPN